MGAWLGKGAWLPGVRICGLGFGRALAISQRSVIPMPDCFSLMLTSLTTRGKREGSWSVKGRIIVRLRGRVRWRVRGVKSEVKRDVKRDGKREGKMEGKRWGIRVR